MIEQYIFNKITEDPTLASLLSDGNGGFHIYPGVVPRGIEADKVITFTQIGSNDAYPKISSVTIQYNIFAPKHAELSEISQALSSLFNEDNLQTEGGISVVFSQRQSETDLGYDFDEKLYQRETSYYYKLA